jgi:RimJ/RimL family protein N-acetyltransferase
MIEGELVRLRALERSDLPAVVRWMNDPEVTKYLLSAPLYGLEEMEQWYNDHRGSDDRLLAMLDERGEMVGYCGITRLEWEERRCNLWLIIGERNAWNHGYGTDTVRTMLRYLFEEVNLHRVYLTVDEENRRAIGVYERCGFRREGVGRSARFKNGRYRNDVTMAVLREEWNP